MGQRVREDTYLDRTEASQLETAADALGVSKSAFIRDAVNEKIDRLDLEAEA